jgi:hypothetical protein
MSKQFVRNVNTGIIYDFNPAALARPEKDFEVYEFPEEEAPKPETPKETETQPATEAPAEPGVEKKPAPPKKPFGKGGKK